MLQDAKEDLSETTSASAANMARIAEDIQDGYDAVDEALAEILEIKERLPQAFKEFNKCQAAAIDVCLVNDAPNSAVDDVEKERARQRRERAWMDYIPGDDPGSTTNDENYEYLPVD